MQHLRCTPQVTIGILLVLVAACGEGKAVPTSGPAGLVISVQGEVSATRPGQATRALEVNDSVFGDDTLVTGPASSVEVEFVHNGARWQLGADSERRVDTSLAWRAQQEKRALLAPGEAIKTGSAGRNTGREAAESRETLLGEDAEYEESAEVVQPVEHKPDRSTDPARKPSATREARGRASNSEPADSRQYIQPVLPQETQLAPPPPPPPPPPLPEAESSADADDLSAGAVAPSADPLRSHVLEVTRRCHAKHGGRGTLTVAITVKDGKASHLQVSHSQVKGPGTLGAARTCIESALGGTALPAGGPLTESIRL